MPLWLKSIISVIVVVALGTLSGLLTASAIRDWYASLVEPPGTPPNWLFGPVWTVLYTFMGIAVARIWHLADGGVARRNALISFVVQMLLNLAWTPVFFGAHRIGIALVIIIGLLIMIGVTIHHFRKLDRPAAILLAPYFLWVSYATYLNAGYLALN